MVAYSKINSIFVLSAMLGCMMTTSVRAQVVALLDTDFSDRVVSGDTASNITWVTDPALLAPGDLTVVDVDSAVASIDFHDTVNASGHFAPDLNVSNEGAWSVDVVLNFSSPDVVINLDNVSFDWSHFNNTGNFQPSTANRIVDWTAEVVGSTSGIVTTGSVTTPSATSGDEVISFTSSIDLDSSENWLVRLRASATGLGNNTGLDTLTINGTASIPEPSSVMLTGLGIVFVLVRRRR